MRRRYFILGCILVFILGSWVLDLRPQDLWPSEGGRILAGEFFSAALQPAIDFQDLDTRELRSSSFLAKVASSLALTVRYAVAAMSLALLLGIVGGILGSRAWWPQKSKLLATLRLGVRLIATALRSIHELIWALLLLTAFGTSPLAAVIAIAIPYGGNLAKVFSELFDEADASATQVMKASGGSGLASFLGGTFTRAFPDLVTYSLYRLECAVRSSAVLGFVGIPTLGYEISTAFEDGHYHEIWTCIYGLIILSLCFEKWSGSVRNILSRGTISQKLAGKDAPISTLWHTRSRSPFLRLSFWGLTAAIVLSWFAESQWGSGIPWEQRSQNLDRFFSELVPYPVRESGDWSAAWPWFTNHLRESGGTALWQTFNLANAAILLAGAAAVLASFWGARSLAHTTARNIHLADGRWRSPLARLIRALATIARSLPEFILAFLLLQVLGPTVWALILALAIHNAGILARLGAEVLDNLEQGAEKVMLAQGGTRGSSSLGGLLPTAFNRWILFLLYRWESCIREATVLGILGVGSLGFLISEARVRFFYDEMLLWIILGAGLVFLGDLLSDGIRKDRGQKTR